MSPLNWDRATRLAFRGLTKPSTTELPTTLVDRAIKQIEDDDRLLARAAVDAIRQLDRAKSEAVFFRGAFTSETRAAQDAETHWRDLNPGLAALVDNVKGGAR
jgi:hypothetical protein